METAEWKKRGKAGEVMISLISPSGLCTMAKASVRDGVTLRPVADTPGCPESYPCSLSSASDQVSHSHTRNVEIPTLPASAPVIYGDTASNDPFPFSALPEPFKLLRDQALPLTVVLSLALASAEDMRVEVLWSARKEFS